MKALPRMNVALAFSWQFDEYCDFWISFHYWFVSFLNLSPMEFSFVLLIKSHGRFYLLIAYVSDFSVNSHFIISVSLSINDSVYSCLFFFLTGLHFFHLLVGLFLCCLLFWSCSFSFQHLWDFFPWISNLVWAQRIDREEIDESE